jgi:hypothetical protein
MPTISRSAVGRTLLLAQLSAHPSRLSPDLVLSEMRSFAASPSFDELLRSPVSGPEQQGIPPGSGPPITIGWGCKDRVVLAATGATSLGALSRCEAALVSELRALPDVGQASRIRAGDPQQHKLRSPLKGSSTEPLNLTSLK